MDRPAMRSAKTWLFILALAVMAGTMSTAARADDAQAKTLFKAMSDYLAAQQAISFDFDSTLEVVTDQDQKLGLASSGTLVLNRPDKLHATRKGGFADVEMDFDGKTMTLLRKDDESLSLERASAGTRPPEIPLLALLLSTNSTVAENVTGVGRPGSTAREFT